MIAAQDQITDPASPHIPRDGASSSRPPIPDSPPPSAPRDPILNSLICALLNPYETIEEIAEDRNLTVIQLAQMLAEEPVSSALDRLRAVFMLRAEVLALHARAAAVGRLTRITTNCDDHETARRAATTLLRMFTPDGKPAPLPPSNRTGSVSDRAPLSPLATRLCRLQRGEDVPASATGEGSAPCTPDDPPRPPGSGPSPHPCATHSPRHGDPTNPKRERGVQSPSADDPPSRHLASDPLDRAATVRERPSSHANLSTTTPSNDTEPSNDAESEARLRAEGSDPSAYHRNTRPAPFGPADVAPGNAAGSSGDMTREHAQAPFAENVLTSAAHPLPGSADSSPTDATPEHPMHASSARSPP